MVRRTRRSRAGVAARNSSDTFVTASPYIKRQLPFFDPLDEEQLVMIEKQVDWMFENIGFAFRDDPESIRIWKEAGVKVVGDKVFAATLQSFGAYAEYICLAEDGPIALKPTNLTHAEAAAVPIGARTAFHYLKKIAVIEPGQKVLIYGASGSVGTYAVQLAKYFGAEVTGVCSTSNLEMVKSLGADKVIDYTKSNFTDDFETYDVIFITVDKCPFAACKNALHKNGVYLNIGRPVSSLPMIWASMTSSIKVVVGKNAPESKETLITLKQIIEQGQLKPVIDRNYSIDQIVKAHRYADQGHKKGNLVITIC